MGDPTRRSSENGAAPATYWIGVALFALSATALYTRLYFGIDLTDDAFYTALPYAFSLGHRPLVDELAVHQFAGILLVPFVKAWLVGTGSVDGLVLFARHLYFATAVSSALIARSTLGVIFGSTIGWLCAALALAYVPFMLPTLSYNTVASLGMLAGSMWLASGCLTCARPWRLAAGTACLAIAGFAYPPVALAGMLTVAAALVAIHRLAEPEARPRMVAAILGTGFVAVCLGLGIVFSLGGLEDLDRMVTLSNAFAVQGGGFEKLLLVLDEFKLQWKYLALLGVGIGLAIAAIRFIPSSNHAAASLLLTAPGLVLASWLYVPYREPFSTTPFILSGLGIASLFTLARVRRTTSPNKVAALSIIVLPSVVCGVLIIWASANGIRNAALGLMPASLVFVGGLSCWRASAPKSAASRSWLEAALAVCLTCFLVFEMWTHVYRDAPIRELDAQFDHGAWMGIRTTATKLDYIEALETDIEKWRFDAESILFMDYFPGGYLLSDLRPRTPALWLFPWNGFQQGNKSIREIYADELIRSERFPDMVVRITCLPMPQLTSIAIKPGDPFAETVLSVDYRWVATGSCYRIIKRTFEP
jgi:hypothetical protein